jgi:hypothetical protein
MNDDELFDAIHAATALNSQTSLASVQARGEQLSRRRYRPTIGVAALAAVAVVAVAVPALSSHNTAGHATAGSTGSSSATGDPSGSGPVLFSTAAYDVSKSASGVVKVTVPQLDALTRPGAAAQLQRALIADGVPAVVRDGQQQCPYQEIRNLDALAKTVQWIVPDDDAGPSSSPVPAGVATASTAAAGTAPGGDSASSANPIDPNQPIAVPRGAIKKVSFNITASALPAATSLQIWADNPTTSFDFFAILAGPSPHC